jgi:uncharacterized caspase-like protein
MSNDRRYRALLLGVADYETMSRLKAPLADVASIAEAITDESIGLFPPSNVTVHRNFRSTQARPIIDGFFQSGKPDDLLLIYFSGHGAVGYSNDDGYLCCVDTTEETRASTGIEFSWISDRMRRSKAGAVVAIFDCCFAGRLKSGGAQAESQTPFSGAGVHYLGSSSANVGSDDAAKRGQSSPFTAAVVQGLRSNLGGPLNGFVTVQDLEHHLANTVVGPQPEFSARKRDGRPIAIGRTAGVARPTTSFDPTSATPAPPPAER